MYSLQTISFREAEEAYEFFNWRRKDHAKPRSASDLDSAIWWIKNTWDSFRSSDENFKEPSLIMNIADTFATEDARKLKPMGYARDYFDEGLYSHEQLYNEYVHRFFKTRKTKSGDATSYYMMMKARVDEKVNFFSETVLEGVCGWLWRMAQGTSMELEAVKKLEEKWASFKGFKVESAPNSMERDDVDAVLRSVKTGKVAIMWSIKNLGALSQGTVDKYRGKGKTKPHQYFGRDRDGVWTSINAPGIDKAAVVKLMREAAKS